MSVYAFLCLTFGAKFMKNADLADTFLDKVYLYNMMLFDLILKKKS